MLFCRMASKPFTPEEARRIVQFLQKPAVFLNMTKDWPALHWTVEHLSTCLTERVRFRIGKRNEDMGKPQTLNRKLITAFVHNIFFKHNQDIQFSKFK